MTFGRSLAYLCLETLCLARFFCIAYMYVMMVSRKLHQDESMRDDRTPWSRGLDGVRMEWTKDTIEREGEEAEMTNIR